MRSVPRESLLWTERDNEQETGREGREHAPVPLFPQYRAFGLLLDVMSPPSSSGIFPQRHITGWCGPRNLHGRVRRP